MNMISFWAVVAQKGRNLIFDAFLNEVWFGSLTFPSQCSVNGLAGSVVNFQPRCLQLLILQIALFIDSRQTQIKIGD